MVDFCLQSYGLFITLANFFGVFLTLSPSLSATLFATCTLLSYLLSSIYRKNACNTPTINFLQKTLRGSHIHHIFAIGISQTN